MRACSLGLAGLGFRVRDKVRVSLRDRVGVRVSTFYFSSHQQPAEARIPAGPHFTHNPQTATVKSYSWSKNQITVRVSRVRARVRLIILVGQCQISVLIWFSLDE